MLNLLNYLSAEAAETLRTSDTIPDTPKETAGQAVFKDILAMKEPENETPAERGGEEDNASE